MSKNAYLSMGSNGVLTKKVKFVIPIYQGKF